MQVTGQTRVRRATAAEAQDVLSLCDALTGRRSAGMRRELWQRADGRALIEALIEKGNVHLATVDDALAGLCLFVVRRGELQQSYGHALELRILFVRHEHRRRGVGGALLDAFLAEARARRAEAVTASVAPVESLERLLARRGFGEVRRHFLLAPDGGAGED